MAANLVGAALGMQRPRNAAWYVSLRKPGLTPSEPMIGAVWTVLDGLLVAAGARLMRAPTSPARTAAVACWSLNLAGIAGYPWVFFQRKRLGASTAVAGTMFASAAALASTAARVDRVAAGLSIPLVVWLGLTTLLNAELWRRNR